MDGSLLVLICVVSLGAHGLLAQDTLIQFSKHSYQVLSIDAQQNVYLLDPSKALLAKYFAAFNYDSSLTVGRKNLGFAESFIRPNALLLPDNKTIYVLDPAANEIKLLNYNLRVQRTLHLNELNYKESFQLHTACVMPTGELWIQNALNAELIRINTFGAIDRQIGGNNFAEASITEPAHLLSARKGMWAVLPGSKQIVFFDLNGVWNNTYEFSEPFEKIKIASEVFFFSYKNQIYSMTFPGMQKKLIYQSNLSVIDFYITEKHIFILNEQALYKVHLP